MVYKSRTGLLEVRSNGGDWTPFCTGTPWTLAGQVALADAADIETRVTRLDHPPQRTVVEAVDAARHRRQYGQNEAPLSAAEMDALESECADVGEHWASALVEIDRQYMADIIAIRALPLGVSLGVAADALGAARRERDTARRDLELALTSVLAGDE